MPVLPLQCFSPGEPLNWTRIANVINILVVLYLLYILVALTEQVLHFFILYFGLLRALVREHVLCNHVNVFKRWLIFRLLFNEIKCTG